MYNFLKHFTFVDGFDILRPLEEKFLLRVTRQMSTKVCKGPSLSQLSTKKWMNGDVYNDYNVPYVDRFPNLETLLIVEGYLAEPTWIEPRNSLTQWISSLVQWFWTPKIKAVESFFLKEFLPHILNTMCNISFLTCFRISSLQTVIAVLMGLVSIVWVASFKLTFPLKYFCSTFWKRYTKKIILA